MTLTAEEAAAIGRLRDFYNGDPLTAGNAGGFAGKGGMDTNFVRALRDVATAGAGVAAAAVAVDAAAPQATAAATTATAKAAAATTSASTAATSAATATTKADAAGASASAAATSAATATAKADAASTSASAAATSAATATAKADAAGASASAAATSAATATAKADAASTSASAAADAAASAAASAAGVHLPPVTAADAGKVLTVSAGGVLTLGSAGITVKKNTGTTISAAVHTLNFTGTSFDIVNSGSGVVTVNFGFLPWRYFRIEAMTASHPPRPSGSTYYNDIREIRIFLSNDGSGPNQALGRVVTVSASAPEYNTTWINDGNDSTRWASPLNATSPPWVTFDFGEAGLTTPPASCVIVPAGYDASFLATQIRFGVSKDGMAAWLWSPVYSTSTVANVAQFFTNIVYS